MKATCLVKQVAFVFYEKFYFKNEFNYIRLMIVKAPVC